MGMKNKAVISVLEMLAVVAILLVTFSILFPGFSHENRWEEAFISLKGRDLILTLDRIGDLQDASFSEATLRNFLDKTVPTRVTNLIHWSGTDGTIKPVIVVACDCTEAQKDALIEWIGRIRFNNRDVDFDVVTTGLNPIYPASDVLLIWGDKDLSPFKSNLENYLKTGKGIVEIMELKGNLDSVQQEVFGLGRCSDLLPNCGIGGTNEISFIKADSATRPIYISYKYFHNIPMAVWATGTAPLILGGGLLPCLSPDLTSGTFRMREADYNFWICGGTSVYFDTGGGPAADIQITQGEAFVIDGQDLLLSYIDGNVKIGVSFSSDDGGYSFKNFLDGGTKLYPDDGNVFRILASKGNYTTTQNPIPAVIVNENTARAAWVADFTKNLDNVGDDHKLLLGSLLSWAANKKYVSGLENLRLGHLTSYVNVVNQDMYEIYRFDLGLGFPF